MPFSASIILPVINETFSLKQTLEIIASENEAADIEEYIIVVCEKTTEKSRETAKELQAKYGGKIILLEQKLKFLGGAIRDAFDICKGTHVVMMCSDLETDPHTVKDLIRLEKENPEMIVTASRWKTKGGFSGYSTFKLILNWVFQVLFSILYWKRLSDMTFGFRIFPSKLVKSIQWEELRHAFVFETLIKSLKLGVKVVEVPTKWVARTEGESQNTFFRNFEYLRIGIKGMFYSRKNILKS
jgi:glycosyltransferase involved in cell wall biosynthesis